MKVLLLTAVLVMLTQAQNRTKATFFALGDYGNITDPEQSDKLFEVINNVLVGHEDKPIDKPDFFVSTGDNLYA